MLGRVERLSRGELVALSFLLPTRKLGGYLYNWEGEGLCQHNLSTHNHEKETVN